MNEHERILQAVHTRTLDETLQDPQLIPSNSLFTLHSARVSTDKTGKVVLRGETPDGKWVDYSVPGRSGVLIPDAECFAMEATTAAGMHFCASKLTQARSISEKVSFSAPTEVVFSSDDDSYLEDGTVHGLVTPFENSYFLRRGLEFEVSGGHIRLKRRYADSPWEISVIAQDQRPTDCLQLADAFREALSFCRGKAIHWRAYTRREGKTLKTHIFQPRREASPFTYRPFPDDFLNQEKGYFEKATAFFLDQNNDAALDLLAACWDIADNYFVIQGLVTSAAVEGLAKQIHLRFQARYDAVAGTASAANDSEIRRIAAILCDKNQVWAGEALIRGAAKLLRVQVSPKEMTEINKWYALRKEFAHGTFHVDWADDSVGNARLQEFGCVAHILNVLTLAMMNYTGRILDFSTDGWPPQDMPYNRSAATLR